MIESSYQYHWFTAYARNRMSGHRLDWENQPAFFKEYPAVENYLLPLSGFSGSLEKSLFELFSAERPASQDVDAVTRPWLRRDLAEILLLTSVPTAKSSFTQGEIWYRSNASAGALHPLEFYLAFPGAEDLPPGLYHYDLLKPALQRLSRQFNPSGFTTTDSGAIVTSGSSGQPVFICLSALYFRSAWKYRDRAYRYMLLDCGHALENLALALKIKEINFTIELDFDDALVNKNLLLDEEREVALAHVFFNFPETPTANPAAAPDPPDLVAEAPLKHQIEKKQDATGEIIYPALHEIHRATSSPLANGAAQQSCRSRAGILPAAVKWQKIPDHPFSVPAACSYIESLSRRRSRRNFSLRGRPLTAEMLFALLGLLAENSTPPLALQPEIIFSAHAIKDFPDGLYFFDCDRKSYARLDNRDCRRELATAALDQRWVANAALQFIFFADLEFCEKEYGPRSYRYLNINAGRMGQRLYLGATALNTGCCAVGAFYDWELAEICSLSENFAPLYLVALGPVAAGE